MFSQPVPSSSGERLERRYPANQDVLVATFPKASEEDTDKAIQAARAAFDSGAWSNAPARNRANGIKVVLSSVMPTCDYIQNQSDRRPNSKIIDVTRYGPGS